MWTVDNKVSSGNGSKFGDFVIEDQNMINVILGSDKRLKESQKYDSDLSKTEKKETQNEYPKSIPKKKNIGKSFPISIQKYQCYQYHWLWSESWGDFDIEKRQINEINELLKAKYWNFFREKSYVKSYEMRLCEGNLMSSHNFFLFLRLIFVLVKLIPLLKRKSQT